MWITSISLLFLLTPQVFPKFLLILTPIKLQIRLSGFGHQICPTSTPNSSKFFSSIHLDLCDHVKIMRCLKGEGGYGWGSFCHGLSLYVILSQVIANCWKKVKQPSHSEENQHHVILSFSAALSSSSYPLIFLFEGFAPNMSWRKYFSWLFKSKFIFEKFSSFCGLYPVLDLHSMVF
jgi:hypothetical protein